MPAHLSSLIRGWDTAPPHLRGGHGPAAVPVTVWNVLDTIPDPRKRRGRRYTLATVLAVALAAVAAGAKTLREIGEWAADLPERYRPRLGIGRNAPSAATIRRVLIAVDPDILDAVLSAWTAALSPPEPGDDPAGNAGAVPPALRARSPIALDGKTSRGARLPDGSRVHLMSMASHDGIPLGQVSSHGKDHEIAAFRSVLDRVDIGGAIITADALHTQRSHVHYLHRHGAHYAFTVKKNQPRLHAQIAGLPWDDVPVAHVSDEKGHGRRERRTLALTDIGGGIDFPHAKRVGRIVRTRRMVGDTDTSTEVVYVVASLGWGQADAAQIAALIRGHWAIENRVHWLRDQVFDEDRHQLRIGDGPRTMACLRNTVLALIRTRMPGAGIAAATRSLSRRHDRGFALLE